MRIPLVCIVCFALAGIALASFGCKGEDTAPTNTKNSQYVGTGQTAADQIGADRAAAHHPRLPGRGANP